MGYVSTWIGSALLMSLMALQLMLVDLNPFQPCYAGQLLVVLGFAVCFGRRSY